MTVTPIPRPARAHLVDPAAAFIPDGSEPCIEHPDLWFPDPSRRSEYHQTIDQSIAVCNTCPRQFECLQKAKHRHEKHGVWGGVNFDQIERRPFNNICPQCGKRTRHLDLHRDLVHRTGT